MPEQINPQNVPQYPKLGYSTLHSEMRQNDKNTDRLSQRTLLVGYLDRFGDFLSAGISRRLLRPRQIARYRVGRAEQSDNLNRGDISQVLRRLTVDSLNPTFVLPPIELAKYVNENVVGNALSGLAALGLVGGDLTEVAVNTVASSLNFLSSSSNKSKGHSFLYSLFSDVVDSVPVVGYFINDNRFNKGLKKGDRLADVGTIGRFFAKLEDRKTSDKVKKRIAKNFNREYYTRHSADIVSHFLLGFADNALKRAEGIAHQVVQPIHDVEERIGGKIPIAGEALELSRMLRSLSETAANEPVSAAERVKAILELGPAVIESYTNKYDLHNRRSARRAIRQGMPRRDYMRYEKWRHALTVAKFIDAFAKRCAEISPQALNQT